MSKDITKYHKGTISLPRADFQQLTDPGIGKTTALPKEQVVEYTAGDILQVSQVDPCSGNVQETNNPDPVSATLKRCGWFQTRLCLERNTTP